MIEYMSLSMRIRLPSTPRSPPNRRCQSASLITATSVMPGCASDGAEHATQLRADAEHREVVRVDQRGLDALGLVGLGQVRADRPDAGDVVEQIRAPQVEQLGNRQADVLHVLAS